MTNKIEIEVSIIIVNYRTLSFTRDCVYSILNEVKDVMYEIIIVDNASNDGSVEELKLLFPNVNIVVNRRNVGFGQANNIGVENANGKFLLLLNSDTLLINNSLCVFIDMYKELRCHNKKIGALGGIMLDSNKCMNYFNSYGKYPTIWLCLSGFFNRFLIHFKRPSRKIIKLLNKGKSASVDFIVGADLFIPRNVFEEMKGFDPAFFMYWEEVDLQKRMKNAGYELNVIPGIGIIHFEGSTTARVSSLNRERMYNKSLYYYFSKHHSKMELFLLKIILKLASFKLLRKYSKEEVDDYYNFITSV